MLNFDGFRRIGNSGKSGPLPFDDLYRARFFRKAPGDGSRLRTGRSIASYQVRAGPFEDGNAASSSARLEFRWLERKLSKPTKRYLYELEFRKGGGDCAKLYEEAFQ